MRKGKFQAVHELGPNKLRNIARHIFHAFREIDPRTGIGILLQLKKNRSTRDAIFIHIPKTAGTSLISMLERKGGLWLLDEFSIRRYFRNSGLVCFGHLSIPSLIEAGLLSPQYLRKAWKFAFVRNPYDRAVSLYHYSISKTIRSLPPSTTFSIFCSYLEERAYESIGPYNVQGLSLLNSQISWLLDADGGFLCDFVGHVENLEEDFAHVRKALGMRTDGAKIPRANTTNRRPIESYYSEREMEVIRRVYAEDFGRFGYDPSRLPLES